MEDGILFSEQQRFNRWISLPLVGLTCFLIFGLLKQVITGEPFGDKPMSNSGLLAPVILMSLITWMILATKLETIIKKDGIYIRFFPFIWRFKKFAWDDIAQVEVKQYNPIMDYGGWGLRMGLFGKGRAYNVGGDKGIQLVFHNGERLLIGTQKEKEAADVIEKISLLKF